MIEIFNTLLIQPLFNILIFLYNFIPPHDLGLSVIILTIIVRALISPLSLKAVRSQRALTVLQPKIKEIQDKHKGDAKKQNEEVMKLYKESKTNPFSGCLPLLIQLPIFIALFQILKGLGDSNQFSSLYSFVQRPAEMSTSFLGVLDLAKKSSVLAVMAGAFQFIQSKMMSSMTPKSNTSSKGGQTEEMTKMMTKQMTYMMPVILVFIYWNLPSVLSLYWIVITIFSIGEQYYINKKIKI